MTPFPRRTLLIGLLAMTLPGLARAQDARAGDLSITQPWSRAAGANGTGAGFLTIRNAGGQADRLLSVTSPAARSVELHAHIRDGDVMRMRPVSAGIALPAGETVMLQPGGLHVMLIGLTEALRQGGEVPLTLRFERAGEVLVMLTILGAGARAPIANPAGHPAGHSAAH